MGALEELDKAAPSLGALDVLDQKVAVRGHVRGKPTKAERRAAIGQIPLVMAGPGGPISLDRQIVASSLPAALGSIAGAVTKPFAAGVPAASLAGSLGELGGEAMMGDVPDLGQIARAGATQGALEAGGRGLAAGAKLAAKPLMQLALRADPEIALTALREGIAPNKLGVRKLLSKLGNYGAATKQIVADASKAGKPYNIPDMLKAAYQDALPDVSLTGDEAKALGQSVQKFLRQNPAATVNASELHRLKQVADEAAKELYNLPLGQRPNPAQQAASGFYKSFADRARQALNASVPGYEASNAPTEALVKLKNVLAPTARKQISGGAQVASALLKPSVRAAVGAQVGYDIPGDRGRNAAIGAGLGLLGASPTGLAALSSGLNNPLLQLILRQTPRAVGSAVQPY